MLSDMGDNAAKDKPPSPERASPLEKGADLLPYLREMAARDPAAERAAQVVEQVANTAPALFAPHVPSLLDLLSAEPGAVSQVSARTLVQLTRVAPAKVAKHLDRLRSLFESGPSSTRDGTLQIFIGLCRASVVYQKRLIDVLERALSEADPPTLTRWASLVLPALKGQPHFQARELLETRLRQLSGKPAEQLADLLGVPPRVTAV